MVEFQLFRAEIAGMKPAVALIVDVNTVGVMVDTCIDVVVALVTEDVLFCGTFSRADYI